MDRSEIVMASIAGAAIGGCLGYLFLTPQGRTLRRRLESAFEDAARELVGFRTTLAKANAAASEGWRLLDDFGDVLGDGRYSARHAHASQTSPF